MADDQTAPPDEPDEPEPGRLTTRLDAFQRRHPRAAFPLAVLYKYADDFGGYLAALLTYYAFMSLFPLLLLASSILGFVLDGNPHLQRDILDSALAQFPVIGDQLRHPSRLGGGTIGVIVGFVGALYGSVGAVQALQYAMNTAWSVPRNNRPNPIKARSRSLALVFAGGLALLATTGLSAIGTSDVGSFGWLLRLATLLASSAINIAVFLLAFRIATSRELTTRDVAPGAITLAIAWQLLQSFGSTYVNHVVRNASATNAVFAIVLGLVSFLYLAAVATVMCIEVNVVRVEHLYPRALLTPFTDNVQLTRGDRRAYRGQAKAQRAKGFERVDVSFDDERRRSR
ncbi:MAG TPA: YihY/virulence factor BrkB family protein [Jatrophihabitantaceae bacterium]|nr:YihY/virulence factor BrkB family protein [Jatrophihabitantaceae bacterium]